MILSGAAIGQGQVVTVSYAVPTGNGVPLKDADNENALPFTDYPVTNNSTVTNTTPPFLVSAEVSFKRSLASSITFNEAPSFTADHGLPVANAFTVKADGVEAIALNVVSLSWPQY